MHPAIVLGACSRRGFFEVLKFLFSLAISACSAAVSEAPSAGTGATTAADAYSLEGQSNFGLLNETVPLVEGKF